MLRRWRGFLHRCRGDCPDAYCDGICLVQEQVARRKERGQVIQAPDDVAASLAQNTRPTVRASEGQSTLDQLLAAPLFFVCTVLVL